MPMNLRIQLPSEGRSVSLGGVTGFETHFGDKNTITVHQTDGRTTEFVDRGATVVSAVEVGDH